MPLPPPSPRPPHQGALREDLLVLRHIFDLNLGRQAPDPMFLGENLPDSFIKDLLIVGLDVENAKCPTGNGIFHVASNDANFTVRALLLIATVDAMAANQSLLEPAQKSLLSGCETIGRGPIPLSDRQKDDNERREREQNRKIKALEKRYAKREEMRKKYRDSDLEAQKYAERQAKREKEKEGNSKAPV
ncbi:uncharacterized protein BP5553_07150 [Venustampulla echinocandica]|uniref:Uncharacterized protein n=1 Tax=Venustampulla echinocandica TaxID=2656787 RepID=A0A370TIN2_9HELO|nr:uncharacterized protein BP5553_07150 [Venustampulla echinocandica]RDL35219.1 hypothetical protein BP5553_07150 [Venustampulla echinocandica]